MSKEDLLDISNNITNIFNTYLLIAYYVLIICIILIFYPTLTLSATSPDPIAIFMAKNLSLLALILGIFTLTQGTILIVKSIINTYIQRDAIIKNIQILTRILRRLYLEEREKSVNKPE